MKLRILPAALADLDNIDAHIASTFGVPFAVKTQNRLLETFELLVEFPHMGHTRPDITGRPVRFFHRKPYWIVYSLGEPLLIHRVYHAARDLGRIEKS